MTPHRGPLPLAACAAVTLTGCATGSKTIHTTANVYPAIGPYSQMVQSGSTYYLSGVIPLNKAGNAIEGTTIEAQARLVLTYIGEVLKAQGMTHDNVVMSNVFMKDLNELVRLPRDVKIEIAVIAVK